MANQNLPFQLSAAPFPEGWTGDLDEYGQQLYANTSATVIGNFLTGLILPPGSTLPTTDQGPVAMNETWYFWDATTGQYLPQASTTKGTKNYVRNSAYQIAQQGTSFTPGSGITGTWDMAQWRGTVGGVVTLSAASGPPFSPDNDLIATAIKYTTTSTLVATPAATDIFVHEHLIEGIDAVLLQGQVLSLSFSVLATVAGTYSVYITNAARDASYVANFTVPTASVWTRVKVSGIPAFPTSTVGTWTSNFVEGITGLYIGVVTALGSQFKTVTTNQWIAGFFAGTASNLNMMSVTLNQLTLTGFKLESAAGPTYYMSPSSTEEFELMQRYYYTTFDYQLSTTGLPVLGVCSATAVGTMAWSFPRRMSRVPTVTPYSPNAPGTPGAVRNLSTGVDVITIATLGSTRRGITANGIAMTGAAKSDVIAAIVRCDARIS